MTGGQIIVSSTADPDREHTSCATVDESILTTGARANTTDHITSTREGMMPENRRAAPSYGPTLMTVPSELRKILGIDDEPEGHPLGNLACVDRTPIDFDETAEKLKRPADAPDPLTVTRDSITGEWSVSFWLKGKKYGSHLAGSAITLDEIWSFVEVTVRLEMENGS